MNPRTTWWLTGAALLLGLWVVIFEVEPGERAGEPVVVAPPLLAVRPLDVERFEVRHSNAVVKVQRAGLGWQLLEPTYPGDTERIEEWLKTLTGLRRHGLIGGRDVNQQPGGLTAFGLQDPSASITLGIGTNRVRLHLGSPSLVGGQVYAQVVGAPDVALTDASILASLPATSWDWRDRRLVPLAETDFDGMTVTRAGRAFQMQRAASNGLWRLVRPMEARADADRSRFLAQQLLSARITSFVTDDARADLETYGLQVPELEMALELGTNLIGQIQFGRKASPDLTHVFARRAGQSNVFLVPQEGLVELLGRTYTFFRDRTLLSLPSTAVVHRIEAKADEFFALERGTNGQWQVVAPYVAPADGESVRQMLEGMQRLQVVDFESDVVTDFAPFGLDPPARRYTLWSSAASATGVTQQVLAQLDFARPLSNQVDRVRARRADEKSVYLVPTSEVRDWLPRAAFELRGRRLWSFAPTNITEVQVRQRGEARQLRPHPVHGWSEDAVVKAALEELWHQLSEARAVRWVGRGEPIFRNLNRDFELSIEVLAAGGKRTHVLHLGRASPAGHVYAMAPLEDPQPIVFELSGRLAALIAQYLSISTEAGSNSP